MIKEIKLNVFEHLPYLADCLIHRIFLFAIVNTFFYFSLKLSLRKQFCIELKTCSK